jgi:hypothetical protein
MRVNLVQFMGKVLVGSWVTFMSITAVLWVVSLVS